MEYEDNIEKLIAAGNGATAVADIINAEAYKQKLAYEVRGILCGNEEYAQNIHSDGHGDAAEDVSSIVITDNEKESERAEKL